MSEYDIHLEYRKGEEHVPADFMSRLPSYGEGEPLQGEAVHLRSFWVAEEKENPNEEEKAWDERENNDQDSQEKEYRMTTRAQRRKLIEEAKLVKDASPTPEVAKEIEITSIEQPVTERESILKQRKHW